MFILHKETTAHRGNDKAASQPDATARNQSPAQPSSRSVLSFLDQDSPGKIKVNSIYMLLALEFFIVFFFLVCCCKTESHYVTQAILKLTNLSASTSLCSLGWPQTLRPFCFSLP